MVQCSESPLLVEGIRRTQVAPGRPLPSDPAPSSANDRPGALRADQARPYGRPTRAPTVRVTPSVRRPAGDAQRPPHPLPDGDVGDAPTANDGRYHWECANWESLEATGRLSRWINLEETRSLT